MSKRGFQELVILYLIMIAINFVWSPLSLGYPDSILHPYLIPVLLTAARHGINGGLLASLIGALLTLVLSYVSYDFPFELRPSGRELAPASFLDHPLNMVLSSWILLGAIIGSVLERLRNERDEVREELKDLIETHNETKTRNEILETENLELREKVLGEGDTVATVYEMASRLTTLKGQDLYHACLELVEKFVGSTHSSIYLLSTDRRSFQLVESRKTDSQTHPQLPELTRGDPLLEKCVNENKTVSIRELFTAQRSQQKIPAVLCAPLGGADGQTIGVLIIESLPFESLNSQTISVLELLADWTSRSLAVVKKFERGDDTDTTTVSLSEQLGRRRLSQTTVSTLCRYEPTLRMALRVLGDSTSPEVARWNAASLLNHSDINTVIIKKERFGEILDPLLDHAIELGSILKALPVRRDKVGCQGLRARIEKRENLAFETCKMFLEVYLKQHHPEALELHSELSASKENSVKQLRLKELAKLLEFIEVRKEKFEYCFDLSRPPKVKTERIELLRKLRETPDRWTNRLALLAEAELGYLEGSQAVTPFIESGYPLDAEAGYWALHQVDTELLKEWPKPTDRELAASLERVFAQCRTS